MKDSEMFYGMADYIEQHGFAPDVGDDGGPRCFVGSKCSVQLTKFSWEFFGQMLDVAGVPNLGKDVLMMNGWTDDARLDAIAACEIAGDIAHEREKAGLAYGEVPPIPVECCAPLRQWLAAQEIMVEDKELLSELA